ncbi:phosphotransferase family [Fusarium albosuccineum]|uniref:Phosphotransferase family n=1 Tax=Fusarium albosuccineum TaxID=1237068 RepID=A0A8H4L5S5_9HYPO|nr:phosphotransferase family [Fusarium albosuccineum]
MNDIVVHTNIPANILPSQTYASADEWYSALGDMNMAQLVFQHNDAVEDKDDARDKYVARQLFRNVATERHLVPEQSKFDGDIRLFSEDFRPVNVAEKVQDMSLTGNGKKEPPLSQCMRESWEKRTWMLNYAARKGWAFDFIWWKFLDESYFGPNENQDYQARLELLSESQGKVMESFVARKIEESGNRKIIKWGDRDAADHLAEVLV